MDQPSTIELPVAASTTTAMGNNQGKLTPENDGLMLQKDHQNYHSSSAVEAGTVVMTMDEAIGKTTAS